MSAVRDSRRSWRRGIVDISNEREVPCEFFHVFVTVNDWLLILGIKQLSMWVSVWAL